MYQLRVYTLRTAEALQDYATVHWPRHIPSLRAFGVTTHGTRTNHDADAHRLIALMAYPDGAEPISPPAEPPSRDAMFTRCPASVPPKESP